MATHHTSSLFPNVPSHRDTEPSAPAPQESASQLVGIARLAAESPLADAKRGTEYFQIPVKSILNTCSSTRMPFRWTINPYRGCEFGCKYCYARYTHEYMELDGGDSNEKFMRRRTPARLWLAIWPRRKLKASTLRSEARPIRINQRRASLELLEKYWKEWPSGATFRFRSPQNRTGSCAIWNC